MELTKVTFHYSDGSKQFITGAELEKWRTMNGQVASYAAVHGMSPDWKDVKWSKVPSSKEEQENFEDYKKGEDNG
jgi:hypothetical protein